MAEALERLSAALADRYTIERELGQGGMATVYLAHDPRHDRKVALKVLRPELAASLGPERFLAEIRLTAKLQHPHIVPLFDSGEAGGFLYYVMPYLEGESLRARLERETRLDVEAMLTIARPVAQALAYAHELGIVHRDIKPENILLCRGQPFVTDFGIARAVTVAGGERLTGTGVAIGTPAYMSPEQALGEATVDARSDVYSLGCVIFEMLSGSPPFSGPTVQALLAKRLVGPPPHLTTVPGPVDAVVRRSLATAPQDRFATAVALADALVEAAKRPATPELSLVVLPFENLSPDPDNAFFADGLTEELITDLSKVKALRVISRTSAMHFKGTTKQLPEIAHELNVRYVLEGSVRRAANSLRITAQLIDGATDGHLWAERYSGSLDDVFDIQEKVARSIVDALKVKLTSEEEQRMAERPIADVQAHDFYLRAYDVMYRAFTAENIDEAIGFLEAGLSVVGDNALLLASLANVYVQAVRIWVRAEADLAKAEAYARRALDLDPDMAQAYTVLGYVEWLRGNPSEYYRMVKRALSLDPNDVETIMWAFWLFVFAGRTSKALDLARRMTELDPVHPYRFLYPAVVRAFEGRFGLAVEDLRSHCPASLLEQPGWLAWTGHWLVCAGRTEEAMAVLEPVERMTASDLYVQICRLLRFALEGQRARVDELARWKKWDCYCCSLVSAAYVMVGDREEALNWLETAVDRGFINYPYVSQHHPLLATLRDEPRFTQLMERVKLAWEKFET